MAKVKTFLSNDERPISREEAGFETEDWNTDWELVSLESILDEALENAIEEAEDEVNIITFCESPIFLGQELKPVQKVVLKCFYNLSLEEKEKTIHLRSFPYDPEGEWLTEREYINYLIGQQRTNILDSDNIEKSAELILACGRRFGKTFVAAAISAYEAYKLIIKGDPQKYYGLLRGRKLKIVNVATSSGQALELSDQAKALIFNSPWFERYLAGHNSSEIRLRTKRDLEIIKDETLRFGKPRSIHASIVIEAIACTARGSRGGTVAIAIFDELAHFVDNSGNRSGDAVYGAMSPSITDFGMDGKLIAISSPWIKSGVFYDIYKQSLPNDDDETGDQNVRMFQIPTWESRAELDFKYFESRKKRKPEDFDTEFGAQFVTSTSPFFEYPEKIDQIIDKEISIPNIITAHRIEHTIAVDPASLVHGYALCMVHPEIVEITKETKKGKVKEKIKIVIVDDWRKWVVEDKEFEDVGNEIIDPNVIDDYILSKLYRNVRIGSIVYDQYGASASSLAKFKRMGLPAVRTPFSRTYNMMIYKRLKFLVYSKRIRLPNIEEGIIELKALEKKKVSKKQWAVEAPATGEVVTDDMADVLANACYQALEGSKSHSSSQILGTSNGQAHYSGEKISSYRSLVAKQKKNGIVTNLEKARQGGYLRKYR